MRNRIKIKIKKICSTGFGKSEFYFGKGEAIAIVKKTKKPSPCYHKPSMKKKVAFFFAT
jgi:hypothetical protein